MSKLFKVFLAVMFAASVVCGQIDWSANRITISTAEELHEFRDTVNTGRDFAGQTVLLLNNINLNGNQENQWEPIGGNANRFNGTFDGNNNVINGIFIDRSDGVRQGFFGFNNGTIRNLGVDVNIIGIRLLGGLSGTNAGTIINSYATGNIKGDRDAVGGLVGLNFGVVKISYAAVNVAGGATVGGLVGSNDNGMIEDSYAVGNVEGGRYVGGLVGINFINSTITNSYATGNISGQEIVGGLVGHNNGTTTSCYVLAGIAANFFGFNGSGGTITNSGARSGNELRNPATFTDWNFTDTWGIHPGINNDFPYLRAFAVTVTWDDPNFTFNGEEQIPTATATTANGDTLELEITINKEAAIDAATDYIATAELKTPRAFSFLLNARKEFEIKPKPLEEDAISPIGIQRWTGVNIRPNIAVMDGTKKLTLETDYDTSYINNRQPGFATVFVHGKGNYTGTIDRDFRIVEEVQGITLVEITWGNNQFEYNGEEQYPTPMASNGAELEIDGKHTNAGTYPIFARLRTPTANVILIDNGYWYTITPKTLTVQWDTDTITFDGGVQFPRATAKDGDIVVLDVEELGVFHNINNAANSINAGKYSVMALIKCETQRDNYRLTNNDWEYEIFRRPLNVVINEEAGKIRLVRRTQSATERNLRADIDTSELDVVEIEKTLFDTLEYPDLDSIVLSLIDFDNFVLEDNRTSIFGNQEPILKLDSIGDPFRFSRSSLDLLRYRIYLLTIETGGMTADNYRIADTTFVIRSADTAVFIRNRQADDSRFGIVLENAVVTDLARISVVTPEPATVNLAIFDALGNIVFSETAAYGRVSNPPLHSSVILWNLANQSGRYVANGAYLIVAEATGVSGRRYLYSTRIGVNR